MMTFQLPVVIHVIVVLYGYTLINHSQLLDKMSYMSCMY